MTQPELSRPCYREGQRIDAADLTAEQQHLLATRHRHQITGHGRGIAHGLTLSTGPPGLTIAAGAAVDGRGRTLVVPEPLRLPWPQLPSGAPALDLWLCHTETTTPERITDEVRVRATRTAPDAPVPVPHSLPPASGTSPPRGAGPPSGRPEDRVYLGRLLADSGGTPYLPHPLPLQHPHAVAATVTTPRGTTLMLASTPLLTLLCPAPDGTPVRRLAVTAHRDTTITGALLAPEARLAPGRPLRFGTPLPAPAAAQPWQWYRTAHTLRIELGAPQETGPPDMLAGRRFAVATTTDPLTPQLTVDAKGTVTVGDLTVHGTLVHAPISADTQAARLLQDTYPDTDTSRSIWTDPLDTAGHPAETPFGGPPVDPHALALTLHPADPPTTSEPATLHYHLTVTNTGAWPVTGLSVIMAITVNDAHSPHTLCRNGQLTGHSSLPFTHTVALPPKQVRIHLTATALGVLPGGRIGYGSADMDWPGTPPGDEQAGEGG